MKSIKVIKEKGPETFFTVALVTLLDKQVKKMVLGNVDHFLEVIEKIQTEKVHSKETLESQWNSLKETGNSQGLFCAN